nr:hypothetical protein [Tanacetum cinerariifolium]
DDDDDDEQTDFDNDGDDFVHPKFSTYDEEDKDEESFDPIIQTPSHVKNTEDKDNDEDSDGMNVEGDIMDDEGANQEDDADELYRDVNINLEEQVKVQVSKILPKIEKTINEQLEAEVLTRSSNSSKTSHAVATDLSKLELKKILIDKMERNKSFHISDEQNNLYKALVDAYECDKLILDTYEDTEFETGATDNQPVKEASQHPHCNLAKKADSRTSFNEVMDTPVDFLAFVMNRLKVDTLTLELFGGPTYELMKGSCKSLVELEFFLEEVYKAKTDQLD